jgi:hypothetical protein
VFWQKLAGKALKNKRFGRKSGAKLGVQALRQLGNWTVRQPMN